jgi:hypothetical protein
VILALAGWNLGRTERAVRTGDPAFVYLDPLTGQPTRYELDEVAGLTPTQRKAWAAHVFAYGQPPPDLLDKIARHPYLDITSQWRWSDTNEPINDLDPDNPFTGPDPQSSKKRRPAPDQHQYIDSQGVLRWRGTNQTVSQHPNRPTYLDNDGILRWSDTREPVDTGETADAFGTPSPSLAFKTGEDFVAFGDALKREFVKAGIDDCTFYLQGSAATNRRYEDGSPFGPDSDFDVLVVSNKLAHQAAASGTEFRTSGISQPIDLQRRADLAGIGTTRSALTEIFERDVNFRVVASKDFHWPQPGTIYIPTSEG